MFAPGKVLPSMAYTGVPLDRVWFLTSLFLTEYILSPLSVLNRVYNFLPVCPNYKLDEICLYSNYTKVMTITLIANKWLINKTACICLLS